MKTQKISFKNSQGLTLRAELDIVDNHRPQPCVLCLHGFGSSKENSRIYSDILNPLGFSTLRIDFQGAGDSEGEYAKRTPSGFLSDAVAGLEYLFDNYIVDPNRLGVIGHSMGGATAILLASRSTKISCLVATCPSVDVTTTIAGLYNDKDFNSLNQKGYIELRKDGQKKRLNKEFFIDANKFDLIQEAQNITYPFLLISSLKDTIVPYPQVKYFSDKIPNSTLITLQKSEHNLEADWNQVKNHIKNWFRKWPTTPPSTNTPKPHIP